MFKLYLHPVHCPHCVADKITQVAIKQPWASEGFFPGGK